ncbi:hypothetical protein ACFX15_030770 [Malus domestica]
MKRQLSFSSKSSATRITRPLVFYFSIPFSIFFLSFVIIWVNKTAPPNSLPVQETSRCLRFNTTSSPVSSFIAAVVPPVPSSAETNLTTGNSNSNISAVTSDDSLPPKDSTLKLAANPLSAPENASSFSGTNSLVSGMQRKENETDDDEQDRGGGELDGNELKTEEQSAAAVAVEQNITPWNKSEEQNAALTNGVKGKNVPLTNETEEQNAALSEKQIERSGGLLVEEDMSITKLGGSCDYSTKGRWIKDNNSYPLYTYRSCSFIEKGFNCEGNGRLDTDFMKWRWQPEDCGIPRFNARKMLELMRGKRLVFVGDSLNRNQCQSMVCMLMGAIRGLRVTKGKRGYTFTFVDYKCTVEFYTSPFLVDKGIARVGQRQVQTLQIDAIDRASSRWRGADILIFDTGHWWNDHKTNAGMNFYQEGGKIHPHLDVSTALRKAMMTWGSWVDKNINPRKTRVFFRSLSPTHFRGGQWNTGGSCTEATEPLLELLRIADERNIIAEQVVKQMKTRVTLLNITGLSEYRVDGHPSVYGNSYASGVQDCSHWCLPGVPDMWNELLYFHLLQ